MMGEENDSIVWRSLPRILESSQEGDICNSDDGKWLLQDFYIQEHMISNIEYAKLKLSNFAVKILKNEPIIVLFDTGVTCSCISHHLFQKYLTK